MFVTLIWFVPALVLGGLGSYFVGWQVGLGLALLWIGIVVSKGLLIVRQQQWYLIERLGTFKTVYFGGWHVLIIGVDRIRAQGDFQAKRLQLYADEDAPEMDFEDGSARIDASIWYRVAKPDDVRNSRREAMVDAVKAWVYTYAKPEERIFNLVDSALRPLYQIKKIDQASVDRNGTADAVVAAINDELALFGAYFPDGGKRLVIEDIDLPDDVKELRLLALQGTKRAQESENEAGGYWKAIKAIRDNLGVTTDEARSIYETQRGLDTLRETKPAMNLVGENLKGVLGTINLGNKP